jgi:hypothetical protein
MNPIKKIKDLPPGTDMGWIKFRYPHDGQVYYWFSQWEKGVWGKRDPNSGQMFPLFVGGLKETLEWEVVP